MPSVKTDMHCLTIKHQDLSSKKKPGLTGLFYLRYSATLENRPLYAIGNMVEYRHND